MTSTHAFINRLTREPFFFGDHKASDSAHEPKPGDIATLHTAYDSLQIRIATAKDRSYIGEIVATTNRRTRTPSEVEGETSAAFNYAQIVSFASSTVSGQTGQ